MGDKRSLNQTSPKQSLRKKRRTSVAPVAATPILRLKIQRLRGEDFFISISRRYMITQLKQEVLGFLQSTPGPDISVEITNIRLIYKGKVLANGKSIEFYQIQNEDTIQLVPFRRRRSTTHSPTDTHAQATSDSRPQPNEVPGDIDHIAVISFATSFIEEPSRNENRSRFLTRNEGRRVRPSSVSRGRRMPVTTQSLRSFKQVLTGTHRCVHTAEQQRRRGNGRNEQRLLISQLQTLISEARSLRTDLLADFQSQPINTESPTFQATSENGVFSILPRQQRTQDNNRVSSVPSTDDETRRTHPEEEEKKDSLSPNSESDAPSSLRRMSRPGSASFVLISNTEMNIPVNRNHSTSPIRVNIIQNMSRPRYQRRLDLSPLSLPDSSGNQREDTVRSLFLRNLMNSLSTNQSPSVVNSGRGVANSTTLPGGGQLITQANTSNPARSEVVVATERNSIATSSQQSSEEADQDITTGSRLRNMFVQFLSHFTS